MSPRASSAKGKATKAKQAPPKAAAALDGASSVFAAELVPDENLLWQSRPGAGTYALAHMRAVILALTFSVVAIIWHTTVKRGGMMSQLDLVTWLFAGIGVLYVLMPVWALMKAKWFVFYALTNQRLMIMQVFPRSRVQSFPIKTLNRVVAHNVHTGGGTLLIDAPGATSKNPATPRAGFYGVRYVAKVAEAVRTLQDPEAALKRVQAEQAEKVKSMQLKEKPQEPRFAPSSHASLTSSAGQPPRTLH